MDSPCDLGCGVVSGCLTLTDLGPGKCNAGVVCKLDKKMAGKYGLGIDWFVCEKPVCRQVVIFGD